jgi:hypothetical protein
VSRYNQALALGYAEVAEDGDDKPLKGHEDRLLAALQRAEQAFEEAQPVAQDASELAELMTKKGSTGLWGRGAYENLAKHLAAAIETIQEMDPVARRFLTWAAYTQGLVRPEPKVTVRDGRRTVTRSLSLMGGDREPTGTTLPLDQMGSQLVEHLENMRHLVAAAPGEEPFVHFAGGGLYPQTGPKEWKTLPLDAFVEVLWEFWTDVTGSAPTVGELKTRSQTPEEVRAGIAVSNADENRIFTSPAARMIFAATGPLRGDHNETLYAKGTVHNALKKRQAMLRERRSNKAAD